VLELAALGDDSDQGGIWNVSCDGDVWGSKGAVRNCFLSTNLNCNAGVGAGARYARVLAVEQPEFALGRGGGLFCQDDLQDRAERVSAKRFS
jgi:hypothetical protein